MSNLNNIRGGTQWIGKDGGVYDNAHDMTAANTRYEQQQKLIEELQRQNDLMDSQYTRNNYNYYTPTRLRFKFGYHDLMWIIYGIALVIMVLRFFTSNDFFSNIGLNVGLSFFFLIMFTLHIINSGFYREPIEEKKTDVETKQKEVLKLDIDPLQDNKK